MVYFNHSQKKFLDPLKVVGVDVNKAMMACSDGRQFENQQFNSKYGVPELKAKIEKVEKGSKEEKALKAELRKALKAAKEERETFFNELIPKMISLGTDAVCIEKLDIPQMYEAADEKLKEDLQDLGLSVFYKELISFCKKNNIPVAQIDVHIPSSKLCSFCGFKYEELKAQKYWICPHCDTNLEKEYDIDTPRNIKDAMLSYIVGEKSIHPIAEYFNSLEWDGISRLDTLLIEYLGAADNEYTRAVTRKTIVAAVARTYKPGIKFDTTLVLTGPQGIGKSTIFSKLAREWFTDSMLISDMGDKKAPEKLLGVLIAEISELAGRRKSEEEIVKGFLSRQTDRFRAAYATKATDYPRSCIIVATANEDNFLKDTSGNRRYWPVSVTGNTKLKSWDLTDEEIDQIWAEAVFRYKAGEKLYLEGEVSKYASELQIKAIETDSEKEGIIEAFLDMKLPNNWGNLNNCERNNYFRKFLSNSLLPIEIGTVTRTEVCTSEIFYECFGWDDNYKRSKSDSLVVIRILQKLGWKKAGKKRVELYGPQEVYRKN